MFLPALLFKAVVSGGYGIEIGFLVWLVCFIFGFSVELVSPWGCVNTLSKKMLYVFVILLITTVLFQLTVYSVMVDIFLFIFCFSVYLIYFFCIAWPSFNGYKG